MDAVATSSGHSLPLKRRRSSSSDDDDYIKRPRYYYLLAPESTDEPSTDEVESVYSLQGYSTDIAKDTSDTSDSMVEFEVISFSEGEQVYPLPGNNSCSSSPTDLAEVQHLPEIILSNTETCDDDSSVTMDNVKRQKMFLFKKCVRCGLENPLPHFRFCFKCYKVRKNFFPPRPKGRKKVKVGNEEIKLSGDSGIFHGSSSIEGSSQLDVEDSAQGKNLCNTCFLRPKNGAFVHKKIVHLFSCYECSIKIIKQTGRCPICKVRVKQVCKVVTC